MNPTIPKASGGQQPYKDDRAQRAQQQVADGREPDHAGLCGRKADQASRRWNRHATKLPNRQPHNSQLRGSAAPTSTG